MFAVAAAVDCEALHSSWPAQPVNSWSSLAFVVAGVAVVSAGRDASAYLVGFGAAFVGVGSVLFHGGGGDSAGFLHNWSISVLLIAMLPSGSRARYLAGVTGSAALLALLLGAGRMVNSALALVVAVIVFRRGRSPYRRWAFGLMAAGGLLAVIGRSGGPWCRPAAFLQPHAVWHVLAAAAIVAVAAALRRNQAPA